jgi:hypothetical protein
LFGFALHVARLRNSIRLPSPLRVKPALDQQRKISAESAITAKQGRYRGTISTHVRGSFREREGVPDKD